MDLNQFDDISTDTPDDDSDWTTTDTTSNNDRSSEVNPGTERDSPGSVPGDLDLEIQNLNLNSRRSVASGPLDGSYFNTPYLDLIGGRQPARAMSDPPVSSAQRAIGRGRSLGAISRVRAQPNLLDMNVPEIGRAHV